MSQLRFSIVVPSHDRPVELAACLEALASLDFPHDRFEVIVVDDGSQVPVDGVTKDFDGRLRIRVVRRAWGGPAAARNTGVEIASGRYVVFTADDCRPRADWLTVLDARFRVDPDAGVGGRIENRETENMFSTSTDMLLRHMYAHFNTPADHSRFFTPNNLAFPLAEFRAAGGFIDSFVTGEDRELCDRWRMQGRRLLYAPEAVVGHHHPLGFRGFLHLHYRYGRGSFRFRREAARRGSEAARFEPASFYFDLIRFPLITNRGGRGLAMSGLLCLAQMANAVGFLRQALAPSRQ
ncbi:MAG TPA: glycosyltransferase [Gemmatimonadota bacterium]|nr:glycosyltransferase [Gemmatimonadota bacterium]